MDALISELRESGGLKRDGRRVTLEGVLTGAALGLFLVYTFDDLAAAAADQPLEGGAGSTGPARLPGSGLSVLAGGGAPRAAEDGADLRWLAGADAPRGLLSGGGGGGSNLGAPEASGASVSARAGLLPGVSQPESLDFGQVAGLSGSLSASGGTGGFLDAFGGGGGGGSRGGDGGAASWGLNGSASAGGAAGTAMAGSAGGPSVDGVLPGQGLVPGSGDPLADLAGAGSAVQVAAGLALAGWSGEGMAEEGAFTADLQASGGGGVPGGQGAGGGASGGGDGAAGGGDGAVQPPPPKVLLVQVQSLIGADGLSVEGPAHASATVRQVGLENTLLDMRDSDADVLAVVSESAVPVSAVSALDAATLEAITQQVALLDSRVITGESTSVVVIRAQELLDFTLDAGTQAIAGIDSQVAALRGSELMAPNADELVALLAQTGLRFEALGLPEQAAIMVQLLNQALDNSVVLLGDGNNTVVIDSVVDGFLTLPAVDGLQGDVSLNAQAVGLDGSRLESGAGDDLVLIRSFVDLALENLPDEEDPEAAGPDDSTQLTYGNAANGDIANPDAPVVLALPLQVSTTTDAIALRNSRVDLGAGNDQLLLEGSNQNSSVDGGSGLDLLVLAPADADPLEVMVHGANAFTAGSLEVASIEALVLGDGDDHVSLNQAGRLDDLLVGGDGVDTIDYSSRAEAVLVDLDRGIATDVGAGRPGALVDFEAVIGSQADDQLFFSSAAASVDAGDGDDVLYLRWAPWMASAEIGTLVTGGAGENLFVLDGLDAPMPSDWDGKSGLPVFMDLKVAWPAAATTPAAPESTVSPALSMATAAVGDQASGGIAVSGTQDVSTPLSIPVSSTPAESSVGLGLSDRFAVTYAVSDGNSRSMRRIRRLTPSGIEGIGDAQLLPIAPTADLLSGASLGVSPTSSPQLAIGIDDDESATLYQLGGGSASGSGVSSLAPRTLAHIRRSLRAEAVQIT